MKAIIIAGMPGSGKTSVADAIADEFGIVSLNGGDVLKEIASEKGYEPTGSDWWDTKDGMKFLAERKKDLEFDKLVDKKMIEKARAGNIVITSWTLPWIIDDCFKVWLDASEETRAKRMAKRDTTDHTESIKVIRHRDKENSELYYKLYKIELGKDKKPFDMVINTENMSVENIAKMIIEKFKKE